MKLRSVVVLLVLQCTSLFGDVLPAEDDYPVIRSINVKRYDVWDSTQADWFFAANLMNALHVVTKEYVITDELVFGVGDELDTVELLETERVLRRIGIFSTVRVEHTISDGKADVTITTQDRSSFSPAVIFSTGGGIATYGGQIEEFNVLGTGSILSVKSLYRTENDIGFEGAIEGLWRRVFRSLTDVRASVSSNKFRTSQELVVTQPYRWFSTPYAFSAQLLNDYGSDFQYFNDGRPLTLLPFHTREFFGWISQSYGDRDQLFSSLSVRLSDVSRALPTSVQAFDNTGHVLIGFSSIRQEYSRSAFLNGYETEDVMSGAWGSATMGRVFSMGQGGVSMWYLGAEGEQSSQVTKNLYLFGRIAAGSGFQSGARAVNTYLEIHGLTNLRLTDNVVFTSQVRTQSIWNWTGFRQLVLDLQSGLRGYDANQLVGERRLVANTEFRWFPKINLWVYGLSAVAFHDIGTAFNQSSNYLTARYYNSVGAGLRIHNLKGSGKDAIYRFDFAYNCTTQQWAGLIFSVSQHFSAFSQHRYRAPDVYGRDMDRQ